MYNIYIVLFTYNIYIVLFSYKLAIISFTSNVYIVSFIYNVYIILFTSNVNRMLTECRGLCDAGRIFALQEQTVALLSDRGAARVGQLLLLLPPARALCKNTLKELLFKPTIGDVSIERLLEDMVMSTMAN